MRFNTLARKMECPEALKDKNGEYKTTEAIIDDFFKFNEYFKVPEAAKMNMPHQHGLITTKEDTFNMDVDLIDKMFEVSEPETIQIGVWMICTVPSEQSVIESMVNVLKKFDDFQVEDLPSDSPKARQHLLLILCPENMLMYPQVNPFEDLLRTISQMPCPEG